MSYLSSYCETNTTEWVPDLFKPCMLSKQLSQALVGKNSLSLLLSHFKCQLQNQTIYASDMLVGNTC